MKYLNGTQLVDYIKERQVKQVRALKQAHGTTPKLAIAQVKDDPVIEKFITLKKNYGKEILVEVEAYKIKQSEVPKLIEKLNQDMSAHGIVVQLPLEKTDETEQIVNLIAPEKDVDGLGVKAAFDPATATAINWLLAGYNEALKGKEICIVGNGRLVGAPLNKMWQAAGYQPKIITEKDDLKTSLLRADIIVSATGKPNLIKQDMLPVDCVAIDASSASEDGVILGDFADDVYKRQDLTITPKVGGVGPLTIAVLFDNVIRAARTKT